MTRIPSHPVRRDAAGGTTLLSGLNFTVASAVFSRNENKNAASRCMRNVNGINIAIGSCAGRFFFLERCIWSRKAICKAKKLAAMKSVISIPYSLAACGAISNFWYVDLTQRIYFDDVEYTWQRAPGANRVICISNASQRLPILTIPMEPASLQMEYSFRFRCLVSRHLLFACDRVP